MVRSDVRLWILPGCLRTGGHVMGPKGGGLQSQCYVICGLSRTGYHASKVI